MSKLLELAAAMPQRQARLGDRLPGVMEAFQGVREAVERGEHLSEKERALIGLAIAVSKQCEYCMANHLTAAWEAGARSGEILEACSVAVLMGGGPAMAYTTLVAEALEELEKRGREQ